MKIKLDENLPSELAEFLVDENHDVHTVQSEKLVGHPDERIFEAARSEGRFLITQDLHFSDVRRLAPGTHPGILLVRLAHPSRRTLLTRFRSLLRSTELESLAGCFAVLSDRKLRVRRP